MASDDSVQPDFNTPRPPRRFVQARPRPLGVWVLFLVVLGFRIFLGAQGARTPAMVLQLLIVVLSFSFLSGGAVPIGLAFLLPAALSLVLLFIRPTQVWLSEAEPLD